MSIQFLKFLVSVLVLPLLFGCMTPYKRVLIMNFDNATGDPSCEKLEVAVPEYLTTYMSHYEGMIFLERQAVNQYMLDHGLKNDALFRNPNNWKLLGQQQGADYLIAGSISRLGENFIIVARLFSVDKGVVVPGSSVNQYCREEEDIYLKIQIIAEFLRRQILRMRVQAQPIAADYPRTINPAIPTSAARGR